MNENEVLLELEKFIHGHEHFPKVRELVNLKEQRLIYNIYKNGGFNKFRLLLGYEIQVRKYGYWNDNTIVQEINIVITKIGHFPTPTELHNTRRSDLSHAIVRRGGFNKFRNLMGYELLQKTDYWNDETFKKEMNDVSVGFGYFPTASELYEIGRADLLRQINNRGGICNVRKLLGYPLIDISNIYAYYSKRGKKAEDILESILKDYCIQRNIKLPEKNVSLNKSRIIEFVCNTNKKIGIDVTTTRRKSHITEKWTEKEYYKYLDELWIIPLYLEFTSEDYVQWNNNSPDNVKVMTIYQFCNELQYDLDESTKNKLKNMEQCTFHSKDKFKKNE